MRLDCPKFGAWGDSRKTKTPRWRCSPAPSNGGCGYEWDDPDFNDPNARYKLWPQHFVEAPNRRRMQEKAQRREEARRSNIGFGVEVEPETPPRPDPMLDYTPGKPLADGWNRKAAWAEIKEYPKGCLQVVAFFAFLMGVIWLFALVCDPTGPNPRPSR